MADERKGKPSASSMQRLALCPGSHNLAKGLTVPEIKSPWAESGTKVHEAVEQMVAGASEIHACLDLTAKEAQVAVSCYRQVKEVMELAKRWLGVGGRPLPLVEQRMWDGAGSYSGKFDIALVDQSLGCNWAVVIDMKTGWGDVDPAKDNLQLRTLAVLAKRRFPGVLRVVVAIVQPNLGQPSLAHYDIAALDASEKEIAGYVQAANKPDALRRIHPKACKYCPAKLICDKAMETLTQVASNELQGDWQGILDKCDVAEMVIGEARAQAKVLLEKEPTAIPGRYLAPGHSRVTVTDPKGAYQKLGDIIKADDFLACCNVNIGELTETFAAKSGLKGKTAREVLLDRISSVIETKTTAPSLKAGEPKKKKE